MGEVRVFQPLAGSLGKDSARLFWHSQPGQIFEQLLGTTERFEYSCQGDQRLHAGAVAAIQTRGVVGWTVPGVTGVAVVVSASEFGLPTDSQDGA